MVFNNLLIHNILGNAYGLGKVREKELELVGNYLSFHCL